MLRLIAIAISLVFASAPLLARDGQNVCVPDHASLPKAWQPPNELKQSFNKQPWSKDEQDKVNAAIEAGVDEMTNYFSAHPDAVTDMRDDSIEALIQVTYASANGASLDAKIQSAAKKNLVRLLRRYEDEELEDATCGELKTVLPLAIFAHKMLAADDQKRRRILNYTNAAFDDCESIGDVTGLYFDDLPDATKSAEANFEELFDFHLWSLWFLEAEQIEALELPNEATKFAAKFWSYIKAFKFEKAGPSDGEDNLGEFVRLADLATHVAHVPTAVHRFPLFVHDHPNLYAFHRENFYKALRAGDLDLFASFVDSLRQYGCTPANDAQVRDGTRYIMKSYFDHGKKWIKVPTENDDETQVDHYKLVHRPWTALLGLRNRRLDTLKPGSFGAFVRQKLSLQHRKDNQKQ